MSKPRAIIIGGMGFNVPKQVHRYFDVVKHYLQDKCDKVASAPECDIILIIRDYVHHSAIETITGMLPGVPIVAARAGWSHLYTELERRRLLPIPEDVVVPEPEPVEPPAEPALPPVPVEDQITDEELERLTAPPPPPPPSLPAAPPVQAPEPASLRLLEEVETEDPADDRIDVLMELFKATAGEITPEVRDLYTQKYGEQIPGPIAAAARRRLGLASRRKEPTLADRLSDNPFLREAMILYANVEKLLDRRNEALREVETLNREISGIDKEIEVYRPVIQQFEGLKLAQQKVKQALEQKALQERRLTP